MKAFVKKLAQFSLVTLLFTPLQSYAKHGNSRAPYAEAGKPKHKYVYYPKQNMYYVPSKHVYYVWRHDHWQPYSSVPAMYAHINFGTIPYVNLYLTTEHPYYYNVDHRYHYRRFIFASVAATPAVVYIEKKHPPVPRPKPRAHAEIIVNFTPFIVSERPVHYDHHHHGYYEHHGHGNGHYKGKGRGHGRH